MPAGGYEDALFELKAPSSLHGLTEKVLLARKIAVWYAHAPPTCLRALPLQRMLTVCMLVRCRSPARMEVRQARRHVEDGRTSALSRCPLRPQASLRQVRSRRAVCPRPSSYVWCCPHANPPLTHACCICSGASGLRERRGGKFEAKSRLAEKRGFQVRLPRPYIST